MDDTELALSRFVEAQEPTYDAALAELRSGRKRTHWMWWVFPQLRGLGLSATSSRYGIGSLDEARAYLAHPVLGPRLRESCAVLAATPGRTAREVFGQPDDAKLRSSMTLFRRAAPDEPVFVEVLERFFGGVPDQRTDELLAGPGA